MAEKRPIGYWLKELDRLINERFDEDLAAGELSRRHWQMLHSLAEGRVRQARSVMPSRRSGRMRGNGSRRSRSWWSAASSSRIRARCR